MMSDGFLKTKQLLIISISKIYCRQVKDLKSNHMYLKLLLGYIYIYIYIYIYNGLLSS